MRDTAKVTISNKVTNRKWHTLSDYMKIIDLGWPWRLLTTSTICYPSDSWASCFFYFVIVVTVIKLSVVSVLAVSPMMRELIRVVSLNCACCLQSVRSRARRCVYQSTVNSTMSMTRLSVRPTKRGTAPPPRRVKRVMERSCIASASCSRARSMDSTEPSLSVAQTTVSFLCTARYRTARVGEQVRIASLYHLRQCGIVLKPRSDCLDYIAVCFLTHNCCSEVKKY